MNRFTRVRRLMGLLACLLIHSTIVIHAISPFAKLKTIETLVHLAPECKEHGWFLMDLEKALKQAQANNSRCNLQSYDPERCIDLSFLDSGRLIRAYQLESLINVSIQAKTDAEYNQSVEDLYAFIKAYSYKHSRYALDIQNRLRAGEHINSWYNPVKIVSVIAACAVLAGAGYIGITYMLRLLGNNQNPNEPEKVYEKPKKSDKPVSVVTLHNTITEQQVYHHIEKNIGFKKIVRDNYPNAFKVSINGKIIFDGKTIITPNIQCSGNTRTVEIVYELDWKVKELIDKMVSDLSFLPEKLVRSFAEREIKKKNPDGSVIRSHGAKKIIYEIPEGYDSFQVVFTSWDDDKRPMMMTPEADGKKDLVTRKYDMIQIPYATKIKEEVIWAEPPTLFNHPAY